MRIGFTPEDEAFRQEVRAFFATEYPQDIIEKAASGASPSKDDYQRSERALNDKGWLAVNWPKEYGGTGWTVTQKYIFDEELERAGALNVVPMGVIYVGPVIYTFGTDEQKKRWLPDILESRTFWGQGYSEPESGSDLASLQCKATRDGDHYVVDGTKIWTSLGHYADWIFCLVRSDNSGKPQQGISFICIDMETPGVSVDPIITIDGKHSLNKVHFDNVRVPIENLIGEEGKGWTYAKYLLGHERTSYAHVAAKREQLARLKDIARETNVDGAALWDDDTVRGKVGDIERELDTLEFTVLRALASVSAGEAPGQEASALKVLATENQQHIDELFVEAAAFHAQRKFDDSVTPDWASNYSIPAFAARSTARYFGNRAQSIYGGTNEIQKNVMAKSVLGLPT